MKAKKNINLITSLFAVSLLVSLPLQAYANSELQELREMILNLESGPGKTVRGYNSKSGWVERTVYPRPEFTEDPIYQRAIDLGEPALEVLEPLLTHENDRMVLTAARCISIIGGKRAREVLLEAAKRDERFIPSFLSIKSFERRAANPAIVRYEMLKERPLDDKDDIKSVLMNETFWGSDQQYFESCEEDDGDESGSGERVWSGENGIWSVRQVKRKLNVKEKVPNVCFRTYISRNGTKAIVYFTAYHAPLDAWGRYAVLEKIDRKWKLVFVELGWIS